MFCPNCGTQNVDNNKFCSNCGKALQSSLTPLQGQQPPSQPPIYYQPPRSANPLASATTIGGIAGIGGGALIVIGWFLPWSSVGLGSGLQILGLLATGGVLGGALGDEAGAIVVLLALALAAVVILIPVIGFLCARTGISLIEKRAYTGQHYVTNVKRELQQLRSRAAVVFVLMVLIFVFTSLIPFIGGAILGRGFYLMIFGAAATFLGALFARSQLGPQTPSSEEKPNWRHQQPHNHEQLQLTDQEKQVLTLLEQGLLSQEIAKELGIRPVEAGSLTWDLQKKFGAENTAELVRIAQTKGYLPSG